MKDTFIPSKKSIKSRWFIIDAKNKRLGRLTTEIVKLLRGKNTAFYNPSQDMGNHVVIINASDIIVTGKKMTQKVYFRHSGRPGGKTIENFKELQERLPERIIEKAVKGMLPKTRLGRQLFTKLKVYENDQHPHHAQSPETIIL
jgi:large subunit ribosomal protein L13